MERRFKPGQTIFREGDPADFAYVIQSGHVEIVKNAPGGPVRLALLGEGDMFGEMGLLDERPRSAAARTQGPTVASVIDQNAFLSMLICRPRDSLAVLRSLFERLRDMNRRVAELTPPRDETRRIARVTIEAIAPGGDEAVGPNGAANHFALEVTPGGVCVRDRDSAYGTVVNGRRIGGRAGHDTAPLRAGDNEVIAGRPAAPSHFRVVVESEDGEPGGEISQH